MNITNIKKKLDIFKIFLNGVNLIEASAGTGKTFTIVLLYLRLLLGIGKKNIYKKKLLVHEILVVTFTNTAKEELYIRIKDGIQNLYLTCINKKNKNPPFDFFLKEINNIDEAIYILKKAKNNINESCIYTIHGFCQHILELHTFHLNSIFEDKIIDDEDNLYLQATQDFWRRSFYNLPEDIINIIHQDYKNPNDLLKKIKPFFHVQLVNFPEKILNNKKIIISHKKNIKKINFFKKIWLIYYQFIPKEIDNLKINKKIYSNFNLSRWINDITIWAKSETKDYAIPLSLKYFTKENIKKNTTNNICSKYIIFEETEKILTKKFSLKNIIIIYAIKKINEFLLKEKKKKSLIGFNDLLNILLKSVKKEKYLRNLIRRKYPAVFIDEFQDTDIKQYKIFDRLYKKNKKTVLFLIGDPKQAIYSFRGADIFSYLYAKSKIKTYYYLDTNWRSSINMCKSINFLFSQHKNPFIFNNISFTPILPSHKNSSMNFTINEIIQVPMRFFLQEKEEVHIDDYQVWISKQCANEISFWLTSAKKGKAKITTKNGERILKANDIAILVRNKKESNLIQNELKKLNIISIYSSEKTSIFQTFDAQELLWILESILEPENETLLRQSNSTHIFKKLSSIMKKKSINENSYFLIEKLYEYQDIWEKIGIFYMIKTIILEYQINSNSIEINEHYIKNLNFLHIAELLQEQFQYFQKKTSLISWFQKKILQKTKPLHNEYIRSFNQNISVKIVTIHKSKGLEYPIVWIPFSIDFKKSLLPIYHDKKNFKTYFDIKQTNESLSIADEERLAEDIRFLYVALTRAIVHCSIGIACVIKKHKKNRNNSDIHKSGLGYTIQDGKSMNYKNLFNQLKKISMNNFIEIRHNTENFELPIEKKIIYLIRKTNFLNEKIRNLWKITSFTQLNKENKLLTINKKETISEKSLIQNKKKNNKFPTIHNFPKGENTGLMIHEILKNLPFLNEKNYNWFSDILNKYNISLKWTEILISWIKNIINTPIGNKKIILSKIEKKSCIRELEFFLPIKNKLYSTELNKIIQCIDPISILSPKLFFNPVKGILKGFIDLVFFWKKKYYILDYKSNWLGKNNSFYSNVHIKKEMIKKRYDLQYQIYTIAIHKYLQKKIKNYNYKDDFGGVFYIFLRAVEPEQKNNGIFYSIPDYSLIEKITTLIS
ncbi:exodeoxyribonuclease V subunit beta [Buchnera aphidicola (Acyrthosiphon lactucae)]|uniref:RecBCD enzyme subunit RecB n=1 Tax=Buchnera aphidicola (Acyrthosiphon lactucae) TaxID=1241832 RepID=A0A4D6XSS9_9GAMM|nr:exodeoxyribonuclease V subunit beta [Buchnera aphidicola]QCI17838.1 exodeoxyribonuclease V subunit beta [Buchnera aphidicola (Acyrthosiphon lactucae)]